MTSELQNAFLSLVRLGVGGENSVIDCVLNKSIDWNALQALALQQGLSALVLDGVGKLPDNMRPPKAVLLQWIGESLQGESQYVAQQKAARKMALLFHYNDIRTYVLKGIVIAECYPKPERRLSVDMDCFLLPDKGEFDAWSVGNDLIKNQGHEVAFDYYKNSTFYLPGLTVENHHYMVPFRGNRTLRNLEIILQGLMKNDKGGDIVEGMYLYRPPIMVSAVFLIEHAYSHFLHQGLTWRMVLDWKLFRKKHEKEIQWAEFDVLIDKFGFRRFYDSFLKLGKYLLSEMPEDELTRVDKRMLDDIWGPLDLHDNVGGVKGKTALAGNYWRARWKFRYYSNISWRLALCIQVWGHLFIKNPKLLPLDSRD